jgi:uncharacterized damage-inducible protein DinB
MTTDEARMLLDYNGWANRVLLSAAGQLSPAEFIQQLGASFGSIQGTLVHILDSEQTWLQRWQGKRRRPALQPGGFPDAAALAAGFATLEAEQTTYFGALTDDALRSRCTVDGRHYVLADLVYHAMSHSMYHRGQVASLLRQLGHAPPNTGFRTGFLDERGLFERPGAR